MILCLFFVVACTSSPSGFSTAELEGSYINDEGKAVVDGVETNIKTDSVYCADTDGGKDETVRGIISGVKQNGEVYREMDECLGGILLEYYCEDNKVMSENIRCANQCYFGGCS